MKESMNMKNRIGKKLLAFGLTLTAAVSLLAGCGSAASSGKAGYRTLDEIKKSGEINIGVFSDKAPFGYVDETGDYQGYDIYLAERLAKDLGVKVNYVSTEAASRVWNICRLARLTSSLRTSPSQTSAQSRLISHFLI
jgi:polar amino acid transport system substrate-binding protein